MASERQNATRKRRLLLRLERHPRSDGVAQSAERAARLPPRSSAQDEEVLRDGIEPSSGN